MRKYSHIGYYSGIWSNRHKFLGMRYERMEDTQLGFSEESQQQTTEEQSTQQEVTTEEQTPEPQPIEQTPPPTDQPQVPETLKKFAGEDGQIDYKKLEDSYVNLEKSHGSKDQMIGNLRNALLNQQSQVIPQQPQGNQASLQQQEPRGNDSIDVKEFLDPNGMLTEGDMRGISGLIQQVAQGVIQQDRQQAQAQHNEQQQQQRTGRFQAMERVTDSIYNQLRTEDGFDNVREAKITELLKSDPVTVSRLENYLNTGQGLTNSDVEKMVRDLNAKAKTEVTNSLTRSLGVDVNTLRSFTNAQNLQAANAVVNPGNNQGANSNLNPNIPKDLTPAEIELYKQFGFIQ